MRQSWSRPSGKLVVLLLLAVVAIPAVYAAEAKISPEKTCYRLFFEPVVPQLVQKQELITCCWYAYEKNCCYNTYFAETYYKFRNLVNSGISRSCYLAVADTFCNECDPNTFDFRRFDRATNLTTVYLCRDTCTRFLSACSAEAKASGITTAEQWCSAWPTVLKLHDPMQTRPRPPVYVMSKYNRGCFYGIGYQTGFTAVEREIGKCLPDPGSSTAPFMVPNPTPTPPPSPPTVLPNGVKPFHPFETISDFISRVPVINSPSLGVQAGLQYIMSSAPVLEISLLLVGLLSLLLIVV